MAIGRRKILQKIAGKRKAIDYHLDQHIPELLSMTDRALLRYWHKEVNILISEMEDWAWRLSKSAKILSQAATYRQRLAMLTAARLKELSEESL